MERLKPSVDEIGRITYHSTKKTFKPLDLVEHLGKRVKVITCLNNSEVKQCVSPQGRRYKRLVTRVYSLSERDRLLGHASRFILVNVKPVFHESGYRKVIQTHSKTPHAWLEGEIRCVLGNDDYLGHRQIFERFSRDQLYLAYDPYKTKTFRFCNQSYLPSYESTQKLEELVCSVPEIYCYESGILVAN